MADQSSAWMEKSEETSGRSSESGLPLLLWRPYDAATLPRKLFNWCSGLSAPQWRWGGRTVKWVVELLFFFWVAFSLIASSTDLWFLDVTRWSLTSTRSLSHPFTKVTRLRSNKHPFYFIWIVYVHARYSYLSQQSSFVILIMYWVLKVVCQTKAALFSNYFCTSLQCCLHLSRCFLFEINLYGCIFFILSCLVFDKSQFSFLSEVDAKLIGDACLASANSFVGTFLEVRSCVCLFMLEISQRALRFLCPDAHL